MLYNLLSFFNKSPSTFVCNSYSEKESLKIRKVTSKTSILYNSSNKENYMYCSVNLRNKVRINHVLPDTRYPSVKIKQFPYSKSKL